MGLRRGRRATERGVLRGWGGNGWSVKVSKVSDFSIYSHLPIFHSPILYGPVVSEISEKGRGRKEEGQ
jgi:hypothetical protein